MPDANRSARRRGHLWRILSAIAVAAVAVWAVRSVNGAQLVEAFARASPGLLALAGLANLLAVAAQAWRWKLLLRPVGRLSYPRSLGAMLVSFAMSSVLPAKAGEVARVHLVSQLLRVRRAAVAGSTVLDHIVNGVTLAPLALVIPFTPGLPTWLQRGVAAFLLLALAAAIVVWFVAAPRSEGAEARGRVGRIVAELRGGFAAMRLPGQLSRAMLVGILAWLLEATTAWLALRALGLGFGPAAAALTLLSVNLALAIPSPPGNVGTFEIGAVLALTALGVTRETAIAFALCYHLLQLVPIWVAGLLAWVLLRRAAGASEALSSASEA